MQVNKDQSPVRETDVIEHIVENGYKDGSFSDISVCAFGKEYLLHKLMLSRCGYFKGFLSGQWTTNGEFNAPGYSQKSFETCLAKLYGEEVHTETIEENYELWRMSSYLDFPACYEFAVATIIETMEWNDFKFLTKVLSHAELPLSSKVLDTIRGTMCIKGYEQGVDAWLGIEDSIVSDIVSSDMFWVPCEWDRCQFVLGLVRQNPSDTLIEALNNGINYSHLSASQLLELRGVKEIEIDVLKDAYWQQLETMPTVSKPELGLVTSSKTKADFFNNWPVPKKDATFHGYHDSLKKEICEYKDFIDKDEEKNPQFKTIEVGLPGEYNVSPIPPFRFSVSFKNLNDIKIGVRVYSPSVAYCGSYWCTYIQKQKYSGTGKLQLGIYVCRTNKEPLSLIEDFQRLNLDEETPVEGQKTQRTDPTRHPVDDRKVISAYYTIVTPHRNGDGKLTAFVSVPCQFQMLQSWGWKSTNICKFDEDELLEKDNIQFMIILGKV